MHLQRGRCGAVCRSDLGDRKHVTDVIDAHAAEFRWYQHAHQAQLRHSRKRASREPRFPIALRGAGQQFSLCKLAHQFAYVLLSLVEHVQTSSEIIPDAQRSPALAGLLSRVSRSPSALYWLKLRSAHDA